MLTPRILHTATLLQNGKVLVAGGIITNRPALRSASAELYDPATRVWTATSPMSTPRINHTATLLPNGSVLVVGGRGDGGALSSVELYDPAIGTWRNARSLNAARAFAIASLLSNGKVLVIGGDAGGTTELCDPARNTWTATGPMKTVRKARAANLLPDGRVLIAAGAAGVGMPQLDSADLYNPSNGIWTAVGPLNHRRRNYTATSLPNGMVLVVGGGQSGITSFYAYGHAAAQWPGPMGRQDLMLENASNVLRRLAPKLLRPSSVSLPRQD